MSLTLHEAVRGFILADATLAAKVLKVYPKRVIETVVPDCYAVTRVISATSWRTLLGATDQSLIRIEVTFWAKSNRDTDTMANRLRSICKGFNGVMGTGGPELAVHQTVGPRDVFDDKTQYYGTQLDILAIVDMSTAS